MNKVILVYLMCVFLCCSDNKGKTEEPVTAKTDAALTVQNDLPDLPLLFKDGSKKTAKELKGKSALILFQPDCDHCQREAKDIQENLAGFKDFNLYFVSSASIDEVIAFAKEYKLDEQRNVYLATTTVPDILKCFGPIDAPSIYLYSETGKLIQSFNGEVAIEVVLKYI